MKVRTDELLGEFLALERKYVFSSLNRNETSRRFQLFSLLSGHLGKKGYSITLDQRRTLRVPYHRHLRWEQDTRQGWVESLDLSVNGMAIRPGEEREASDRFEVVFPEEEMCVFSEGQQGFKVPLRVCWCKPEERLAGGEFEHLLPLERRKLFNYISNLLSENFRLRLFLEVPIEAREERCSRPS